MKGGQDVQKNISSDLQLVPPGNAKLKIIHGSGPINLMGIHYVENPNDQMLIKTNIWGYGFEYETTGTSLLNKATKTAAAWIPGWPW